MPAQKKPGPAVPAPPPRRTDALERLYVYWILSTALLLFAVVVATVYTRGALYNQARAYDQALGELGDRVSALERRGAGPAAEPVVAPPGGGPAVTAPKPSREHAGPGGAGARGTPAPTSAAAPTTRPGKAGGAAESGGTEAPAPTLSEGELRDLLDAALEEQPGALPVVSDRAAADRAVAAGLSQLGQVRWSGATWSRLAVVARLLAQDAIAEKFAARAYKSGDPLLTFSEVSARTLLARGRAAEALVHAEHLAEQTSGSPAATVLLARVFVALDNPAAADELAGTLTTSVGLSEADKLALARVYLALQRWDRLGDVMASVSQVPPELEAERSFLEAVTLIQRNDRLVEALSILDYLTEQRSENNTATSAPAAVATAGSPPDEYDIATWRGVALMRGQQLESARQAFDLAASQRPDRPEAYYWRAMLEFREGQFEAARVFLQNALATSARFAPAWEALGQLALNVGDLNAALENLQKAIAANQRRPSAYFTLAIAYAKASRREPAETALRTALALDPTYLEKAEATEVLARLFTPAELTAMTGSEEAPLPPGDDVGREP